MIRKPVVSSMIRSVGYDEASRTLEIEFNSGDVYQYFEVPGDVYRQMMSASSLGRFFLSEIRGAYQYTKMK